MSTKLYPNFASGNIVQFSLPTGTVYTELVFPTSIKKIKLLSNNLTTYVWRKIQGTDTRCGVSVVITLNDPIEIPVVNGKSPNTLNIVRNNASETQSVTFMIEAVGGVIDPSYWNKIIGDIGDGIGSEYRIRITTQPSNVSVAVGETATFTVVADGAIKSYQWQKKEGELWLPVSSGGTTSTFTVTATEELNGKIYRCVVTNIDGKPVATNGANLTVTASQAKSENDDNDKEITVDTPLEKNDDNNEEITVDEPLEKEVIEDERTE